VAFVEVRVVGLADLPHHEGKTVFLREAGREDRVLPIVVGPAEAFAIHLELTGERFQRPLSHDLLMNVARAFDCRVEKVAIVRLEEGTFFAELTLRLKDDRLQVLDARPSDSIVLALKADVPILVEESVMEEACVRKVERRGEAVILPPRLRVVPRTGSLTASPDHVRQAVEALTQEISPPPESRGDQLAVLRREMRSAIAAEDFERAARVRDRIQELEAQAEQGSEE
jgi:bifunctional DNase/RNase